jgi:hypothetical protein
MRGWLFLVLFLAAVCCSDTAMFADLVQTKPCSVQCGDLAEQLVPVAIGWVRGSVTPAALCSDVGVCGRHVLLDAQMSQVSLICAAASVNVWGCGCSAVCLSR